MAETAKQPQMKKRWELANERLKAEQKKKYGNVSRGLRRNLKTWDKHFNNVTSRYINQVVMSGIDPNSDEALRIFDLLSRQWTYYIVPKLKFINTANKQNLEFVNSMKSRFVDFIDNIVKDLEEVHKENQSKFELVPGEDLVNINGKNYGVEGLAELLKEELGINTTAKTFKGLYNRLKKEVEKNPELLNGV